ncbi:MAG TPA: amidohydrolase family protein [Bryobacteraceae bacterium]|nr:amidohydrolase family protein [Bryobacteraceae bacterium]
MSTIDYYFWRREAALVYAWGDMRQNKWSRREWLAGATAAAALGAPQGKKSAMTDQGYIDAHVHVWTPDTQRYPRPRNEQYAPTSFTPEELLAHARPCGVTRVVLIQMSFYGTDNRYMLDAIAHYPGVFSGVGIVDHNAPGVADEMRRLKRLGVRGFRITPGGQPQTWLDAPGMAAMWKCGAEERMAMCPLVDSDALAAIGRMCARHPETPVVIDHLARIGADGQIRDAAVRQLCDLARHTQVHVKVSAFYALGKKQYPYTDLAGLIQRVLEAYGPERLMWATDCPFQVQNGHTYAGSLELVRDRLDFLSAHDREWLLRGTAARVFFAA